jgi:hypothetical protein
MTYMPENHYVEKDYKRTKVGFYMPENCTTA